MGGPLERGRTAVLVVDDEPFVLFFLDAVLHDADFTVRQAQSASEAQAIIDATGDLSALVTDINLGAGDPGWTVARHARSRFPKLAVLYMSGDSGADWTIEGVPNSLMVAKPFEPSDILLPLHQMLARASS